MINNRDFTCNSCGGTFKYDISSKEIRCTKCNSISPISITNNINKYNLNKDSIKVLKNEQPSHVIECSSCGSKITVPKNAFCVSCSYCSTNLLLSNIDSNFIKPESILPFEITYNDAVLIFKNWINSIEDAISSLKKDYKLIDLSKTYAPYWNYDCHIICRYSASGGEVFFKTVGDEHKASKERFIKWHNLNGTIENYFQNTAINADVNRLDFIYKLEHFDFKKLKPFNFVYLNGFSAIKYSDDPLCCFEYAKSKINLILYEEINKRILKDFRECEIASTNVNYNNVKFYHILLPFWIGKYSFNGQIYNFSINGENGKIHGEYPLSKIKTTIKNAQNNLKNQSINYIKDRIPRNFPKF